MMSLASFLGTNNFVVCGGGDLHFVETVKLGTSNGTMTVEKSYVSQLFWVCLCSSPFLKKYTVSGLPLVAGTASAALICPVKPGNSETRGLG